MSETEKQLEEIFLNKVMPSIRRYMLAGGVGERDISGDMVPAEGGPVFFIQSNSAGAHRIGELQALAKNMGMEGRRPQPDEPAIELHGANAEKFLAFKLTLDRTTSVEVQNNITKLANILVQERLENHPDMDVKSAIGEVLGEVSQKMMAQAADPNRSLDNLSRFTRGKKPGNEPERGR
jgi:hypothetical protein